MNFLKTSVFALILTSVFSLNAQSQILDTLSFGDATSEAAHAMAPAQSETVTGALGEPARRFLPFDPPQNDGGKVTFSLKIDPEKQNYVTVKLWGSEKSSEMGRLYLFIDGKQVGYRHLGDVEPIDIANDEPALLGRFFYSTTPLPLGLTKGKTSANLEIRSGGRIWGYGTNYEQYQRVLKQPTRGVYAAYSHTDSFFTPPASEKQGAALVPAKLPVRTSPGLEFISEAQKRVDKWINDRLDAKNWFADGKGQTITGRNLSNTIDKLGALARSYDLKGTVGYRNPKIPAQIVMVLDDLAVRFAQNPDLAGSDWSGFGPAGEAIAILKEPLQPLLDEPVNGLNPPQTRRVAWSKMLGASRDFWRTHRRAYTNQSMIVDINIYAANKGVRVLEPQNALPEAQVLNYLYEAAGIKPWLGSDTPNGPAKPMGEDFFETTNKGLTRELGYVGTYGEILPIITDMVRVTDGDPQLKAQLLKIMKARAAFRYPETDDEGFRAMRLEQVVGWRDSHYPGEIVYGDRTVWGQAFTQAPVLNEPFSIGVAQQALEDNQAFAPAQKLQGVDLMNLVAGYEFLKTAPKSPVRLPMSEGQRDFVFSDEENGVLALKRGEEKLYVSLYWRARYGINNLARVHLVTPRFDRLATVTQESQFTSSGQFYTRNNRTNMAFSDNMPVPGVNSANAGEVLPIAKVPADIKFKPGDENIYAGKADFYRLRYGPYLIGMNTTKDKTFDLGASGNFKLRDLVSGREMDFQTPVQVKPRSTVVFYLGNLNGDIQMKPFINPITWATVPLIATVALADTPPAAPLVAPATSITLAAKDAEIQGNAAKLEGDGANLGSWSNANTKFSWTANLAKPGIYRVGINYAVDPKNDGSEIQIAVGDQTVSTKPPVTESWKDYHPWEMGEVEIKQAGPVSVVVSAKSKGKGLFILNLREVTLNLSDAKTVAFNGVLKAKDATIQGKNAVLEHDGENIGSWNSTNTQFSWLPTISKPGVYRVVLNYSLTENNAGSEVQIAVGTQNFAAIPAATGKWTDYKPLEVGQAEIKEAGPLTVVLSALSKPKGFILNLRDVSLLRVGE